MISTNEREALAALRFNPAPTPDDVWRPSPFDVPALHERVVKKILQGVNEARTGDDESPIGVVVQGRAGSGKTHMLGALRERIQREGGYFFLVGVISGKTFWENTAGSMVDGMLRDGIGWGSQLKTFLRRLTARLGIPAQVRDAVAGDAPLTRVDLDAFVRALRMYDRAVGQECQDTARALVLFGSQDFEAQDIGQAHLISEAGEPAGRAQWGLTAAIRKPQEIVREISRLLALTLSPTVIAIDQIDTLLAQSRTSTLHQHNGFEDGQAKQISPVADGLLMLREVTRRTLTVVSCLPDVWVLLKQHAPRPVVDRFQEAVLPDRITSAAIGEAIVSKRFSAKFAGLHFSAPYLTWPIRPEAFKDSQDYTPRALLRRVERHVTQCLDDDELVELRDLAAGPEQPPHPPQPLDLKALDERFAELISTVDVGAALDSKTEDVEMPFLLTAGLAAWIDEQAPTGATYKHDPLPSAKPALHGRLIKVLDEATENEAHWGFRAIASTSAVAVINRVRAACTTAGLDLEVPQRQLVLMRNGPWPTGPRTTEVLQAFDAAGGIVLPASTVDLKVFAALRVMRAAPGPLFQEWLVARRPASGTDLFRSVLGDGPVTPVESSGPRPVPTELRPAVPTGPRAAVRAELRPGVPAEPRAAVPEAPPAFGLGYTVDSQMPFTVNLESLRRHTVIFAGSGSGKTVLIRRLVEECALKGVSAIVLDPNNDLARLGEAWPEPPSGWLPGDDGRARDYLANTDVVIWTPRITSGRPLSFQPLPDFGPLRESPDEFDQAIRSAAEALAPRAGVNGETKLARQGKAVLTEALLAYARSDGVGLHGFTDFLSDLPEGVSRMSRAARLAHDVAETLKAAMVTDPLFGGKGAAADPGVLLTPAPGKRARVSVISFVGLNSEEQRQSFVNQLQMSLFAWIKRNPAGDRPLGGLFVMDEAQTLAPSSGNTPCTASSIALASQARKYGLGLVFATQAPKGLHNQISGNATTQFFGLLNASVQITAARELAHAKGGRLPEIGLLNSGQFYAASEGFSFVKVNTPMCLTHHPKAPLPPEDVIGRASEG
jgi:hypothetical protein